MSPLPALVTVGLDDAQVLVDVEAFGVVALVGDDGACLDLARSMVAELVTRSDGAVAVELVDDALALQAEDLDGVRHGGGWEDIDLGLATASARMLDAGEWPHTFAARASGRVYDGWAPTVWFTGPSSSPDFDDMVEAVARRPGAGSAVVVVGADPGRGLRIELDADGTFRIPALELSGRAQGIEVEVAEQLVELLADGDPTDGDQGSPAAPDLERDRDVEPEPASTDDSTGPDANVPEEAPSAPVRPIGRPSESPDDGIDKGSDHLVIAGADDVAVGAEPDDATYEDESYEDPEYDILVRLCGEVTIDGTRYRLPPREAAVTTLVALQGSADVDQIRDAIWAGAGVSRKRVQNVVSSIRQAIGDALYFADEGRLAAGPAITTDVELIRRRLAYARHQADPVARAQTLHGGLELVTGSVCTYPNAARRNWSWLDHGDWITHVESIVGTLAHELGSTCLTIGDGPQACWAARTGMAAVGRRDDLTILLVRGLELQGDEAAIRSTLRSYERYLDELGVTELPDDLLGLIDRYASRNRR